MSLQNQPRLSVVVVIVSDTASGQANAAALASCLESLLESELESVRAQAQQDAPPVEIIVPHSPVVEGLEAVQRRFPSVRFLAVGDLKNHTGQPGNREHHDELRARGLAQANGEVIALLEDHALVDRRWCSHISEAHRRSNAAAIGGSIGNSVDRPLNWAVYFCDFFRYQNPVTEGPSEFASDANCSYKKAALESIRPLWQEIFRETTVNSALQQQGETIELSPNIISYQNRHDLRLGAALMERVVWGRSYAAGRSCLVNAASRGIYAALAPVLPFVLTLRIARSAFSKRRHWEFLKAAPALVLLTVAWSLGEGAGYLTGRPASGGAPEGKALISSTKPAT